MARFFCLFLSRFWKTMQLFMNLRTIFWRVAGFEFWRVYLDGVSLSKAVASSTVTVIVSIDALQPLHLLHNLHCVLLNQGFVGEDILLLRAAVQVCACQDVGNCSESGEKCVWFASIWVFVWLPVEQHGNELDDNDGEEEEHKNNSNWLKVQVLFGDNDLGKSKLLILLNLKPV